MIEMETRLRVARGIDKTETQASVKVFETLKQRGHPDGPPPTISDGWGGIDDAMVEVYGKVPEYEGVLLPRSSLNQDGNMCRWSSSVEMGGSSAPGCGSFMVTRKR